jgi:predicted DNA-binding antitoxin AbrB/MazE fold protein
VRAHYENSVLRLLEPVELRDGEEVLVKIERPLTVSALLKGIRGSWAR